MFSLMLPASFPVCPCFAVSDAAGLLLPLVSSFRTPSLVIQSPINSALFPLFSLCSVYASPRPGPVNSLATN